MKTNLSKRVGFSNTKISVRKTANAVTIIPPAFQNSFLSRQFNGISFGLTGLTLDTNEKIFIDTRELSGPWYRGLHPEGAVMTLMTTVIVIRNQGHHANING